MLNQSGKRVRFVPRLLSLTFVALGALVLLTFAREPVAQEGVTASTLAASLTTRLDALDPQVRYLKERKDIFDVLKRYTRGADRHDKDLVRTAFWPEATISFGTQMTRDQYVDWEENELAGYAAHQHHITGQTIDIEGDTAHVESYVVYFLVPRDRSADAAGPATMGKANTKEKTRWAAVATSSAGSAATGTGRFSCASTSRTWRCSATPSICAAAAAASAAGTRTTCPTHGRCSTRLRSNDRRTAP